MSFYKVPEWMAEFAEENALELAKKRGLPEEVLPRFIQVYREICSDWEEFEYEPDEDIFHIFSTNQLKKRCEEFLDRYEKCCRMGHGVDFSFAYALYFHINGEKCFNGEAEAKAEAYKAVGSLAEQEALIECKAMAKNSAFTRKYVESIVNRECEQDAIKWATRYEKGVTECERLKVSDTYIHQYADQRARDVPPEYARAFSDCYERRIEAGDSDISAWGYAEEFTDYLGLHGTTSFNWMQASIFTEAMLLARKKGVDPEQYCRTFDIAFRQTFSADNPSEFKKVAIEILSGRCDLSPIEKEADTMYARIQNQAKQ